MAQSEALDIGSIAIAVATQPAVAPGYLAFVEGEVVKVQYIGCEATEDAGWCFGSSSATSSQGWFAQTAITTRPQLDHAAIITADVEISKSLDAPAPGYLTLKRGEVVKIQYVGQEGTSEDGWLFGEVIATGDRGWFSSAGISGAPSNALTAELENAELLRQYGFDVQTPAQTERGAPSKAATSELENAKTPEQPERGAAEQACTPMSTEKSEKLGARQSGSGRSVASVPTPMRREVAATSALGRTAAVAEAAGLTLVGVRCLRDLPWQYPLSDPEQRSFVGHLPGAIDARSAKRLLDVVNDGMEPIGWEQPIRTMNGKVWKVHSRQTQWLVAPGCKCTYSHGGPRVGQGLDFVVTVKPKDFPPWMHDLMQLVMPLCGIDDPKLWPNCCSVNRYSRDATCDWHADEEDIFQSTTRDCTIISLSLGSKRSFELRRFGEMNACCKFELKGGDLMTMEGLTQKHYQHAVNLMPGPRVNLTWRWIVAHRCGRW